VHWTIEAKRDRHPDLDPQHVCTTIGRENAIVTGLRCSREDLLGSTRAAVQASVTSATRKATLLAELGDGDVNAV
jgi:hypothetical protein